MHLILFGFPGSGKTHFGKKLAKQLNRPFVDTDDLLCALYQKRTNQTLIPNSATNLEFRGHHRNPSLNDSSWAILPQYGSPHDHSNPDHSEPPKFQVDDRVRYSIREIYQALGASAFRLLEAEALESLQNLPPSIIALGGGSVLQPKNVSFLRTLGELIYLDVPCEIAIKQLLSRGIPAFADPKDPIGSLQRLYQERAPIYKSIATLRIPHGL